MEETTARACECGDPDVSACRQAFDAVLAAEFGDPEYFAVHHLTVAAYQAQHPRARASTGAVEVLRRFVEDGVTPEQVRREFSRNARQEERPSPVGAMRLGSVRLEDPAIYRADIGRYARSVLRAAERSPRTGEPAG